MLSVSSSTSDIFDLSCFSSNCVCVWFIDNYSVILAYTIAHMIQAAKIIYTYKYIMNNKIYQIDYLNESFLNILLILS